MAKRKTTETDQPAPSEGPQPKASRPKRAAGADTVYQFKITLRDIRPPIWRRVEDRDCSLTTLHGVIQTPMDWDDYHLYALRCFNTHSLAGRVARCSWPR